jgi:UDP-N-acetylglucosamine--N-acetylmuramyl-(pentapeptide) pyrophosphoryl-undecaprenol N-acetylglucosamine transferase
MASLQVSIACGGTGGHLFPGLAVAETLRRRGHRVMLLVSEKKIDAVAVAGREKDFRIETLPSIGLPSPLLSPRLITFGTGLVASVRRCRAMFRDFQPHAVLGMGGFTSTPPILAARMLGRETFVHESNAIPGKANKLNARFANVVLLGFADCAKYFRPSTTSVVTGTPIREELRGTVERSAALASFGFEAGEETATVLVMGGSQGARGINQAVTRALPRWKASGRAVRFIHQTGPDDAEMVRDAYAKADLPAFVCAFHPAMQDAYAVADLAVARAGAATLTELSHFGIPSILVPFPFAAEDHQTLNAQILARAGAAILVPENGIDAQLPDLLLALLENRERRLALGSNARQLAPSDPAALVADTIESYCDGSRPTP